MKITIDSLSKYPARRAMPKYIITDWTGKVCFHGKQFDDFEEAWGFIHETHKDDEDMWQEYEVEEVANA